MLLKLLDTGENLSLVYLDILNVTIIQLFFVKECLYMLNMCNAKNI